MPVYEYQCMKCGEILEILHKFSEEYHDGCPKCQGKTKRILSPSNFILKGSGFYVNDYPSESRKQAESSQKTKEPEKPTPPKETKPEKAA